MKVFHYGSFGLGEIPSGSPQELSLPEALRVLAGLNDEGSFMGIELGAEQVLQILRQADGTFRTEILNSKTRSFEWFDLNAPLAQELVEGAYAGKDLKETIAYAGIKWRVDHF